MNLLKINKLSFSYGDKQPLFCIENLSFNSKSIVKLEGINGSGKTTFLSLLSDCLNVSPKECLFSFQGKEYQNFSVLRPHRIFVNDQSYFYENLTVKQQMISYLRIF
jgi:ABC-type multidrug transport system ATPase subunit